MFSQASVIQFTGGGAGVAGGMCGRGVYVAVGGGMQSSGGVRGRGACVAVGRGVHSSGACMTVAGVACKVCAWQGDMHGRGGMHGGGVYGREECVAGETVIAVGGMHPNGMHSCQTVISTWDNKI